MKATFVQAAAIIAGMLAGGAAVAATQYTLDAGAADATVTSWSAASNSTALTKGSLTWYTGGLGAAYAGESTSSPQHALDNDGRYESFLLDFGSEKLRLESVTVGWPTSGSYDTDFFVLAYTGSLPPVLGSLTYANMKPENGWEVISVFSNPGDGTVSLDTSKNIYSSFWLIGAGGFTAGTGVTIDQTCTSFKYDGSCKSWKKNYDYLKVAGVGGTKSGGGGGGGGGSVPEPGSLALAGVAFLGLLGLRRKAG